MSARQETAILIAVVAAFFLAIGLFNNIAIEDCQATGKSLSNCIEEVRP